MSAPVPVLTAVTHRWESGIAEALAAWPQVRLTRRCADLPELLGAAAAGSGRVAVVSADLPGLDRGVVRELEGHGVRLLGVHPPGDEAAERTLLRWALPVVLPADAAAGVLRGALEQLLDGSAPARRAGAPARESSGPGGADDDDVRPLATGASAANGRGGPAHPDGDATEGAASPGAATGGPGPPSRPGATARPDAAHRPSAPDPGPDGGREAVPGRGRSDSAAGAAEDAAADGGTVEDGAAEDGGGGADRSTVVVVWGPGGAPGRSTVALNLAAELAGSGQGGPVVLLDADTHGACQAQLLAVMDEAPGLLAAVRAADQGTLDGAVLSRHAPEVLPGLRVLTGVPRPDRWPEVREPALGDVLDACRGLAAWTVVDVGSPLEADEELSFDTAAPRRNGAALSCLEAADRVVVVGLADPVGLQRLVRGLSVLREVRPGGDEPVVVLNRVRAGAVGPDPERRVAEVLQRFAGVTDPVCVPEDQPGLDAAVLAGQALREARPRSPARLALRQLAGRLSGAAVPRQARRPALLRGLRR